MNEPKRSFSALGGYLFDRFRLSLARPINLHSYMKFVVLRDLGQRTHARCLVESGTFLGVTSARCARVFERVHTIELDPTLASRAAALLKHHTNVCVHQGDAAMLLPRIMAEDWAHDVVIFLDGHFSGDITARGDIPEPAVLELVALKAYRDRICGVVVDDFRLFGTEPGFPTKAELLAAAESSFPFPSFSATVHADQLIIERHRVE